jgi:MFS family permease
MFRSLGVRNFRLYSGGQLVALTGTWMQRIAQDWLVLEITNSGTALGLVTALQFAPSLPFGLWGGILADRYDKRRMLYATQMGMGAVALCLGALDLSGIARYWHVLVLAAALGVITAVDTPVRQTFVMEMVGPDLLANAVALNAAAFNAARVLGPAAAGSLIAVFGTGPAFMINAASSIAVFASLALMRAQELSPSPPIAPARGQLREGLAYVRSRPDLLTTMILILVLCTFGLNFSITTALIAKQVFHEGAQGYGILSASIAVGSCLGAIPAARRRSTPSRLYMVISSVVFSALEIATGLMPNFVTTALLLLPTGLVMLTLTTAANASMQLGVRASLRGRVMALYVICVMGGRPLGAPFVGWLAGIAGPRWGMAGGGMICLVFSVGLGLLIARRRGLGPAYVVNRLAYASIPSLGSVFRR